ncbi:penicillin-binding transpeptidase domain-containing protein [Pseudomonadota bacterium]|nr:penicillin-binding transpeptidase domain-containing protein [Pseudomonadota bacterium]
MSRKTINHVGAWRLHLVRLVFISLVLGLAWRLADIQVLHPDFLRHQGDARHIRHVAIPAHRGMILDRNGEPLAISTPVHSIWFNPQDITVDGAQLKQLAKLLNIKVSSIEKKMKEGAKKQREFVYLKRRVTPELAGKVKKLNIKGVALQREYKRFYPAGEVASHLVGFNNVDDDGQEGLELTHNETLKGVSGLKRLLRDSRGNYVGGGEQIKASKDGQNISLSVDLRLQYLTYQALKNTVKKHRAHAGTAVILDVNTGEVLAMANQPAFNPNNRRGLKQASLRNRAVIDLFEPGSTVKPFTVASGLKSGLFTTETKIDTHPGRFKVNRLIVKDHRDYGVINLATLIQKSSNIGSSKVALALKPEQLWQDFTSFGMGTLSGGYFPGENMGRMPDLSSWKKVERATFSYGYGLNTSALQLARGYTVLANGGILRPVSFTKLDSAPVGHRVFSKDIMDSVRTMMTGVVKLGGTASRAAVENYTVAGKTGTIKKASRGGYAEGHYLSLFAGLIPANNPRLVMVVMIDDPQGEDYYGGLVAAPMFSKVMTGAMRLLNVTPDNIPLSKMLVAQQ